jgi:hypothetical protein
MSDNPRSTNSTGVRYTLYFRDPRTLEELKRSLESKLMILLKPRREDERLVFLGTAKIVGADYRVRLEFLAAFPYENTFVFIVECSWNDSPASHGEYYLKNSESWFRLWTNELQASRRADATEKDNQLYVERCQAFWQSQPNAPSVPTIQQAILEAMKHGAQFRSSHKEGNTTLFWQNGLFVKRDVGDYPGEEKFQDANEFLNRLYMFLHWDVSRHAVKEHLTELDIWQLISRKLQPPRT